MNQNISILIAEDNDISRELMSSIMKTQNYDVIQTRDGEEAIKAVNDHAVDLALVDLNMEPKGGFEFVKHLLVEGISLPVIIVTADDSSDILMRASELGVTRVLQKPVEPERLLTTVQRTLKRYGHNLSYIASEQRSNNYTPEQLMQRAIDLADRNAQSKKGGPFGAVIADAEGKVLGEGVNGITSRVDPIAHAEIMAIRQAAEKLERSDLEECILYCSSEPTMMGQALIISVGIKKVFYGLSHDDIKHIRTKDNTVREALIGKKKADVTYDQLGHSSAMRMFERWTNMDNNKLDD